jgi:DNA replication licensing factor MCM7
MRLIDVSKSSLDTDGTSTRAQDPVSALFDMIKNMSMKGNGALEEEVNMSDVRDRAVQKGFTAEDLENCLQAYEVQNIWMITGADRSKLRWVRISEPDDNDDDL